MLQDVPRLQSTFAITAVDAEGFQPVRRGLKAQGVELGDFIRDKPGRGNNNRFQPLALADWQELASTLPPTLSCFSFISPALSSSPASLRRICATSLMRPSSAETRSPVSSAARGGDGAVELSKFNVQPTPGSWTAVAPSEVGIHTPIHSPMHPIHTSTHTYSPPNAHDIPHTHIIHANTRIHIIHTHHARNCHTHCHTHK